MLSKLTTIMISLAIMLVLAGCKKAGDSGSNFFSSLGSSGSSIAGDSASGSTPLTSNPIAGHHNPEPATMALLGSGLLAYALLRSRKKKKNSKI